MATRSRSERRGDHFKAQAAKLRAEVRALRRQLDQRYCEGSAVALAHVYDRMGCGPLRMWLSNTLALSKATPPFDLPTDIEVKVRSEVAELLRCECGWTPKKIKSFIAELVL